MTKYIIGEISAPAEQLCIKTPLIKLCKSRYVHEGCHYGHKCKINIHCTNNFCQCVLHLKCYPSSIGHAEYLSNEQIISQARQNVYEIVSNFSV